MPSARLGSPLLDREENIAGPDMIGAALACKDGRDLGFGPVYPLQIGKRQIPLTGWALSCHVAPLK
jgi:hypothetical protein